MEGMKLSLSASELAEKAKKMRTLVGDNQCLAAGMIVEELNVSGETVQLIVIENLTMKKVCAEMVPRNLIKDQLHWRRDVCGDLLQ
jgi:orotate phosphoribosyltransferase-like protein